MCAALIVFLAFLPPAERLNLHENEMIHEGAHAAAFGATAFLLMMGTHRRSTRLWIGVLLLLFAVGTEAGEHLLFGSAMEYADVAADLAGAALGALLALALQGLSTRRQS